LKKGFSQQVLGVRAKVGAGDVSKIENGRMLPYPGQAKRLARVLGLQPEELQEPAVENQIEAVTA
jgi:transcriptional regulator with XRE-family HTH domain